MRKARERWEYRGRGRPEFSEPVASGQESVWDYSRPPRIEADLRNVVVKWNEIVVAESTGAMRVLETASPPTYYLPPEDVCYDLLTESPGASVCEWKGRASYWSLALQDRQVIPNVGWTYRRPFEGFEQIADHMSFYPARLACFVGGVPVEPQPGNVYGGWVTPEVVGPFKGGPGTEA
jgi:uncharacterized protein (DUF427 family)